MSNSPITGFLRLPQIIGARSANPPIAALIPVGKSCWWQGVRDGRFPQPYKLGARVTVWKAADIHKLIDSAQFTSKREPRGQK